MKTADTSLLDGGNWRNTGNSIAPFLYPDLYLPGAEKNFDFGAKGQKNSKL